MIQYALKYPVLTFLIVCLALLVTSNVVANICKTLVFKIGKKRESEVDGE